MQDRELTYDNLAPLYLLNKSLEQKPDPFRLQGDKITFIVPFIEYKRFVHNCLREVDYLATPTRQLLRYVREDNTMSLYSCYLKDMAIAICKELHYAEQFGKDATHYKHKSDGEIIYSRENIKELFQLSPCQSDLRAYMQAHEYPLPKDFRVANHDLWEYANALYYLAQVGAKEWEVAF